MVNKSVIKTTPREFLDKKIWFRESDTLLEGEELENSEYNDYYMWVSSAPDQFYPLNNDYVRADALIGLTRFGKRRDGHPGCFYESIVQTDCKINSWSMSLIAPLMPRTLMDWGVTFRSFLKEKE